MFALYERIIGDALDVGYCPMIISLNNIHGVLCGPTSLSCNNDASGPNLFDQVGNGRWA